MTKVKFFLRNTYVAVGYILGVILLSIGILNLSTDECKEFNKTLKELNLLNKKVSITTYINEIYKCKIEKIECKDKIAYLKACGKEIKSDNILKINSINIYKIVSDKISKRGIKGIFLVVSGGFLIIITTVLKDYF